MSKSNYILTSNDEATLVRALGVFTSKKPGLALPGLQRARKNFALLMSSGETKYNAYKSVIFTAAKNNFKGYTKAMQIVKNR